MSAWEETILPDCLLDNNDASRIEETMLIITLLGKLFIVAGILCSDGIPLMKSDKQSRFPPHNVHMAFPMPIQVLVLKLQVILPEKL